MLMCFDEDICIVMCIKIFKFLVDFNLLVNLVLDVYFLLYLDFEIDNIEWERKFMNRI